MASGDPHIVTFDNLQFGCQAEGEFVLVQSLDSGLVIQARFKKVNDRVSITRGFVARVSESSPVVQLALPESDRSPLFYVDSILRDAKVGYEDDQIVYTVSGTSYSVRFKERNLFIAVRHSGSRLDLRSVRISKTFRSERVVGLLGSPDDNTTND